MDPDPTDPSEIIDDYVAGPSRLEAAIAGLSEADMDLAPEAESWSIRLIVHHIADGDDIWKQFIKQAIGNPGGEFTLHWYWQVPQVEWAHCWSYRERTVEPSLAMFRANRQYIEQLLKQTPGAMEKCLRVRWPQGEEQDVSVGWVVEMQTRHVQQHIEDIRRIREKHGVQQS